MTTPPRIPEKSDFPSSMILDIVPPPQGPALNVVLLLHGLGDTILPFTNLGKNLKLPNTVCLAVSGVSFLPPFFTGSQTRQYHWGDDVLFDQQSGRVEPDAGFVASSKLLDSVIEVLVSQCKYPLRSIMFLGYAQGGMAALSLVSSPSNREKEFGGVISIGAGLPASSSAKSGKARTPVLVCAGSKSKEVTRSVVDKLKEGFGDIEYVKWQKADDQMMETYEETVPVMRFFARRLRSRFGVPEGAVEIG